MSAEAWLDLMPAIPLSRAVPAVRVAKTFPAHAPPRRVDNAPSVGSRWCASGPEAIYGVNVLQVGPAGLSDWRVDLDDPQGFGYAWRWWCQSRPPMSAVEVVDMVLRINGPDGPANWRKRWERGETTDADRLALAKAIAEVTNAKG